MKSVRLVLLLCFALGCNEPRPRSSEVGSAGSSAIASVAGAGSESRHVVRSLRALIVVLGSSTSAGTGPRQAKNAWVSRYERHLAEQSPNVTLVNLAVGGQTTFHIQPTGYLPPANRPAPVPGKNITAALALKPNAILISMPSNDQASHYPLAEQLANYDRIARLTAEAHVQLWVSTTQPRNFNHASQMINLMQARDAISEKFAPHVLDFWTAFAAPNGFIKAGYDSGDGTHLNDAAHAILAEIVEGAHIPEQLE